HVDSSNITIDYYTTMAHRDQFFKGRRLAASTTKLNPSLSSVATRLTPSLILDSNLHYSFIRVGTPAKEFFVALDTGSDIFWLPCDCTNCAHNFYLAKGTKIELNVYSPSNSTTSTPVPCNSTKCGPTRGCSTMYNACSYEISYGDTSSTGILVDDVLHLGTITNPQDPVDVPITFGWILYILCFRCGKNVTGYFLDSAAINGVCGLNMDSISVPSILANKDFLYGYAYCLAIVKSRSINVIGRENFMNGYRMVFDREKMVLGWKESDCEYLVSSYSLLV
ncbi:hypothetical protein MIMGU_mgv1a022172mg, partial [Erythranthe guttata]